MAGTNCFWPIWLKDELQTWKPSHLDIKLYWIDLSFKPIKQNTFGIKLDWIDLSFKRIEQNPFVSSCDRLIASVYCTVIGNRTYNNRRFRRNVQCSSCGLLREFQVRPTVFQILVQSVTDECCGRSNGYCRYNIISVARCIAVQYSTGWSSLSNSTQKSKVWRC